MIKRCLSLSLACVLTISGCQEIASAAIAPEEAAQLGTALTPWGAEPGGNANGTIPAWSPLSNVPPAPKGFGRLPDPFEGDKPLLSINAQNMDKYSAKLSEGSKRLLKRYPGYSLTIYPSRRHVDYPASVIENTIKNATRARLTAQGTGMEGGRAGIPFPIPKNGNEVMWNHLLRYGGGPQQGYFASYLMDKNGAVQLVNDVIAYVDSPYYMNPDKDERTYTRVFAEVLGPSRIAGSMVLEKKTLRPDAESGVTYVYSPDTRRVRTLAEFAYDAPVITYGGSIFHDELGMFDGKMDRFDFKLIGKKEVFIPYNDFKAVYAPLDKYLINQHTNPAYERWELHRVWVVEATLKKGERHAQTKKTFYIDEDDWSAHLYEAHDSSGQISRIAHCFVMPDYQNKALSANQLHVFYDFLKGQIALLVQSSGRKGFARVPAMPENKLTSEGFVTAGSR